jgi:glycosyltransferase involved in cell wall biosynthesis
MKSVDVLLMPYQESVFIGVPGHDTARWMSPMKMFEYMATGVPIISSDLPVLQEVLENEKNALLVSPSRSDEWISALDRLLSDKELARSLGTCAHEDYKSKHTWLIRAERLLDAAH